MRKLIITTAVIGSFAVAGVAFASAHTQKQDTASYGKAAPVTVASYGKASPVA